MHGRQALCKLNYITSSNGDLFQRLCPGCLPHLSNPGNHTYTNELSCGLLFNVHSKHYQSDWILISLNQLKKARKSWSEVSIWASKMERMTFTESIRLKALQGILVGHCGAQLWCQRIGGWGKSSTSSKDAWLQSEFKVSLGNLGRLSRDKKYVERVQI